ncbi:MAG: bifunctional phosphoserine phosphatase/homoserine phosphotransferase ThrH [Propionibacteriaceae bacterium]|jgi:phosphoserine/homoserine phosphotransferase|nr:bifunctional phosphoserine phosphatase/homoserine phosphotransferase ThrH [Propionibacteriaceae bacterium]
MNRSAPARAPHIACFDLEGVLVPEIWIGVAQTTGIDELRLTTRDVADYSQLMRHRLRVLDEHKIGINTIRAVIADLGVLPGAREFLDWARQAFEVVILSDTFYDFAAPLMRQLDWPTLFAHQLVIDDAGMIRDFRLRMPNQKQAAVQAFQSLNFTVLAAGDSYNDTDMLLAADHGFLYQPSAQVMADFPNLPVVDDLISLKAALASVAGVDAD